LTPPELHLNPPGVFNSYRYPGEARRINPYSRPDLAKPRFTHFYTTTVDANIVSFLLGEFIGYKATPDLPRFMLSRLLKTLKHLKLEFAESCVNYTYQTILSSQLLQGEITLPNKDPSGLTLLF